MMGLEPTTFCRATASERSHPFAGVRSNTVFARGLSGRANATEPERTPNLAILATPLRDRDALGSLADGSPAAADDFVDVAVGTCEMVPALDLIVLGFADEADPCGFHLCAYALDVVDEEPNDRRRSEELVELVRGTIDMNLRAVVEAESGRLSILGVWPETHDVAVKSDGLLEPLRPNP